MIRLFNAVLAAILGSGGSAAPAQHSRIPVVTYGANALAQPAGGAGAMDDSAKSTKVLNKAAIKKATGKTEAKAEATTKKAAGKTEAKAEAVKKKR
jgi:hypothetical protein